MILVGNSKFPEHKEGARWFYVGRPSVLGNIFSVHSNSKYPDTVKVKTVEEAVSNYRKWLWEKIKSRDVAVLNEISRIKTAAHEEDVVLLCWCVDENRDGACHAYVIKSAIEWIDKKYG
jgi:hypothetical protein